MKPLFLPAATGPRKEQGAAGAEHPRAKLTFGRWQKSTLLGLLLMFLLLCRAPHSLADQLCRSGNVGNIALHAAACQAGTALPVQEIPAAQPLHLELTFLIC